ncbi:hypothetical protein MT340_004505 [Staphylococcus sp. NRL 16/872]|uniref:hypothetical protein n=1 Tax=Staphylococcus sp. NRL 16/872 TaxID=2930131 RepID=UPI001FB39846|nr:MULTISPECIES: hypothetical protein [unclassified Staphylococcus]MCJ1655985.1 hypothetical protein [Staphylococcus sp. NRL 21/187]MCJ1661778.1 hypothetical protein [Staphylococcus sp. NRL 18/288]MCJ1667721.1 hypothetical protein [Staphylococcus sp. NRL 19/737]WEN70211.1 hypothetical protein MT340_004505 [Staphylococcus sp. NRL 16/872]
MRIQNRWAVSIIFAILAFAVVISLTIYKNEKTVDLTDIKINNVQLNQQFDKSHYNVNHHIKLDRYEFYNDKHHKNVTVKVKKKQNKIKGIVVINDSKVDTNFGAHIGGHVDDVINYLGDNYRKDKVGKGYDAIVYVDKENHMKLSILYKDGIVKRIEFFSR